MELQTLVASLPFIGPVYARRLARLEIKTLGDLLYHFPHRYEDYRLLSKTRTVQAGEVVTVQGKVKSIKNEYTKRRWVIQKAVVEDDTGELDVIWFNRPFLAKTIKRGMRISLSGKAELSAGKVVLQSPDYEILKEGEDSIHTGRLVPIYPETSSVSSKFLRNRISQFLPKAKLQEFLPEGTIKNYNLLDFQTAMSAIHFPEDTQALVRARYRFAFEELFLLQLSVLERKSRWSAQKSCFKVTVLHEEISRFIEKLPFKLTHAQNRSVEELVADFTRDTPMNRLLEGDVGSGKTVVAAIGAFITSKNNLQTAIMAPTQILATQHYNTLKLLLEPYGVTVSLVTGGLRNPKSEIRTPKGSSKNNLKSEVVVGTHALLHNQSVLDKLAFAVIDEQHKFGVEQRAKLLDSGNRKCLPHVLTMTATPIPRTVALTLYGDLDLSLLDEMPPGRQKIRTWLVPPQKREGAYNWIKTQVKVGNQVFIVCPLIEQSELESMRTVRAATAEFKKLSKEVFPELKLGLLHGRLKSKEKDQVVEKFREEEYQILVSTPVVEVGIDIPNATIMLVEAADRFGLAQLHQLRGRVGRSDKKSYCLLFTESPSQKVLNRLRAMEEAKTGSELAELDLRLRGPGEIFGTLQHGFPELKVASFTDLPLIHKARDAAEEIFPKLQKYPQLVSHLKTHLVVPN